MFELIALAAIIGGVYYFTKGSSQELTPATMDARFEQALKDVASDRALFAAVTAQMEPDPTGAPPSDEKIKQNAQKLEQSARAAWSSGDPHELAGAAAEIRTGLKFKDVTVESKKKIVALTTVFRDKIDSLTAQGGLVDTFFAKIDKLPADIMTVDPAAMQSIADDVATVDFAALTPYTALIDEMSIPTANVIDKNGVHHPVFSKVHLHKLSTSQKIDTPITVEIVRYVKKVVAANGVAASVFVGRVTSAVPAEYYNKPVFVFAEAEPDAIMSAGTEVGTG